MSDMILSRARFAELERRLFIAEAYLSASRAYVADCAKDMGQASESAKLLGDIDIFLGE